MVPDRSAGLAECARALAAGEVTSRALVERTLARIEATQPTLNAFRLLRAEAASRRPTRRTRNWPGAAGARCSASRWR